MACGCIVSVKLFFDNIQRCMFVPSKWNDIAHGERERYFFSFSSPKSHTTAATYISMSWGESISHGILCLWLSNFLFFADDNQAVFILFALSFTHFKWQMDCLYVGWIASVAEATCDWIMLPLYLWTESRYDVIRYAFVMPREHIYCDRLQPKRSQNNLSAHKVENLHFTQ